MPNVTEHLYHDDETLRKVYDVLRATGMGESETLDTINAMQNKGIIFREAPKLALNREPHSRACGIQYHEHGLDCNSNCPTCSGKPVW